MAMTMQQKLDFVHKQTKIALEHVQHFDAGGNVEPNVQGVSGSTTLAGPASAGTGNAVTPSAQGIAGALGNVLGTNNNFQASSATITPGTNVAQLNQAYTGAQGGLNNTGNLVASTAPGVSQGLGTQNELTQELEANASGRGANPAQAALNQNTGNNINSQAALAAGVRGAGSNPGLIASENARVGAGIQQQAVGQEATLEAQQRLAAQQQLQGLSETQVGQGTNAIQLQNQAGQNEQNILQGANTAANNADVSQQENINTTNATVAAGNAAANSNTVTGIGGALAGLGAAALLFAKGGKVPDHIHAMAKIHYPHLMAGGGMVWQNSVPVSSNITGGSSPQLPSYGGGASPFLGILNTALKAKGAAGGGEESIPETAPLGGYTDAYEEADAKGGKVGSKLKGGGKVPGKPKVNRDDYNNDTVNAKLSPGEVVIDLNTLKDKGKLGKMARFVASTIEKKKMGRAL